MLQNKTDSEIIEDLATEFYKRRLTDPDITAVATFRNNSGYCINDEGEKEVNGFFDSVLHVILTGNEKRN